MGMSNDEKVFLVYSLLYDVRLNWADPVEHRIRKAISLCDELGGDSFKKLAERCKEALAVEYLDGRFFRAPFPFGYEGLDVSVRALNGNDVLADRSDEFKAIVNELITCPEFIFS